MFNNTSWMDVVIPTDRPKSVRNRCVIEVFWRSFGVVIFFCLYKGFCHRTESELFLFLFGNIRSKSLEFIHISIFQATPGGDQGSPPSAPFLLAHSAIAKEVSIGRSDVNITHLKAFTLFIKCLENPYTLGLRNNNESCMIFTRETLFYKQEARMSLYCSSNSN